MPGSDVWEGEGAREAAGHHAIPRCLFIPALHVAQLDSPLLSEAANVVIPANQMSSLIFFNILQVCFFICCSVMKVKACPHLALFGESAAVQASAGAATPAAGSFGVGGNVDACCRRLWRRRQRWPSVY